MCAQTNKQTTKHVIFKFYISAETNKKGGCLAMPFSFYITTIYFQWQVCSSVICTRSPACIGDREDYFASPSPVAMYGSTRNNLVIFLYGFSIHKEWWKISHTLSVQFHRIHTSCLIFVFASAAAAKLYVLKIDFCYLLVVFFPGTAAVSAQTHRHALCSFSVVDSRFTGLYYYGTTFFQLSWIQPT